MTLSHRPCGACGALVDVETGCDHWRGTRRVTAAEAKRIAKTERQRRLRAEQSALLAALRLERHA